MRLGDEPVVVMKVTIYTHDHPEGIEVDEKPRKKQKKLQKGYIPQSGDDQYWSDILG